MGCVSLTEDEKKELVGDVHRLAHIGVLLMDSTKGSVMVHNGSESSYVMDVNSMQELDPLLVELNESIIRKSIEFFS